MKKRTLYKSESLKTVSGAVAIASALALLAAPMSSFAGSFKFDGIMTGDDSYDTSFTADWYDGHGSDKNAYPLDGSQTTTTVHYGTGTDDEEAGGTIYSWLFVEVPLYAKNMIWGNDVFTAQDEAEYGKVLSYRDATGSEKLIFGNSATPDDKGKPKWDWNNKTELDLDGDIKANENPWQVVAFKDSVDWLLGEGSAECGLGNTPQDNCAARNRTMSFEIKMAALDEVGSPTFTVGDPTFADLKNAIVTYGLEFHLSPERVSDISEIPVPAAFWLFGTALIGFIGYSRRTNLG